MKTKISFILLIVCLQVNDAYTQESFPKSNALWSVHAIVDGHLRKELIYGLSGDTIIDNKTYSKYYLLNDSTLTIDSEDFYEGGIRVDGKQVWFRPATLPYSEIPSGQEFLLFDFSKASGENFSCGKLPLVSSNSFPFFWESPEYNWSCSVMDLKFSSIINKYIFYVCYYNCPSYFPDCPAYFPDQWIEGLSGSDQWVEGVGSLTGLIWPFHDIPTDGHDYKFKLACMKENDEIKYMNKDICEQCFLWKDPAGIENPEVKKVIVYADNTDFFIRVDLGEDTGTYYSFELIDCFGHEVFKQYRIKSSEKIYYPQNLKGVFIYRISNNQGGLNSGKIILK